MYLCMLVSNWLIVMTNGLFRLRTGLPAYYRSHFSAGLVVLARWVRFGNWQPVYYFGGFWWLVWGQDVA